MLSSAVIETYKNSKDINGHYSVNYDVFCTDRYSDRVLFMSFVDETSRMQNLIASHKHGDRVVIRLNSTRYEVNAKNSTIESQRIGDYTHVFLRYKQEEEERPMDQTFLLFEDFASDSFDVVADASEVPASVVEQVRECIMEHTAVPFVAEWAPYVAKELQRRHAFEYARIEDYSGHREKYGFKSLIVFHLRNEDVESIMSFGLSHKRISIDGCNKVSARFKHAAKNIAEYQREFGQDLAEHTTKEFHPAFNPKTEEVSRRVNDFFDICTYYVPDVQKFRVQKNVIEAGVRCLKKGRNFMLAGQTGVGKTLMSIGTVYASAWKESFSAIVMAPSHLVAQWGDEIREKVPMSEVMIVDDLAGFMKAERELKNPLRMRSLWVVMSYNTVKATYSEHPGVVWSESAKGYVCPHCGRPLAFRHLSMDDGVNQEYAMMNATAEDFLKEPSETEDKKTRYCKQVLDADGKVVDGCGAKLWTASTRENSNGDCQSKLWNRPETTEDAWVKISGLGWVQKGRIQELKESIDFRIEHYNATRRNSMRYKELKRWQKSLLNYEARGVVMQYPHRYSIAKYMRKHLNKAFDFAIFDEVHKLSGDSRQGEAFGQVTNAVKKSVFLTGTLSNGYASGLFYILFRTQTAKMLSDGFRHDSVTEFQEKYGVSETTQVVNGRYDRERRRLVDVRRHNKKKEMPGISPTVVADYLMNNMVSVTKRDISNHLCDYQEIPVGIRMDKEMNEAYHRIIRNVTTYISVRGRYRNAGTTRYIKNALNIADMFLDQPFGLDTGDSDGLNVIELDPKTIRPKEQKLIDLALEKQEAGEKMLVYLNWTQKTDIANRLAQLLDDNGISAEVMGANVKPNERAAWLAQQATDGVDVVIMNPRLVAEGMNLLEYTNIVFYEVGNELTTVRQASQRSNRINQENPVTVYFFYYKGTVQEDSLGLISQKLKASKAIEGDFTTSALQDMTEDTDILTKLVNSIVKDEHISVSEDNFESSNSEKEEADATETDVFIEEASELHFEPLHFSFAEPEKPQYLSFCA